MTSGDELGSDGFPNSPAPDLPPMNHRRTDPAVDTGWLNRGGQARRRRRLPRLSTVLLVAAFLAILVLYLAL
ncbi:hypothetical protein [Nocardia donostiensis]|uniref:Uncharacterized protein n=1 Tax=Nocardia donostiensis TaxID=1538463 RepID=A0A1V2TF54_9NOCA|nr:hypothetical protein [Nocardia donostiensis]ONM48150.1 hypothetical protein B0T46_14230 [Nocardia donostiensis]OQS13860.1 hypothetical protein B0T36_17150 [Nocardia donostiensis]OQS20379.1 hypothetical protein B0T44_10885 [Nocardia donostiensis]